eukprot:7239093-Prymnesium_polylepis.1
MNKVVYDTTSVEAGGIRAYRSAINASADAIVGAARSAVSTPVSLLGAVDKMPQISYWSSSPTLADKNIYTHFARTYPSDAESGKFLMQSISHFGWKQLAVIYVQDVYAQGLVNEMKAWHTTNPGGARVELAVAHTYDVVSSVQSAVAALK